MSGAKRESCLNRLRCAIPEALAIAESTSGRLSLKAWARSWKPATSEPLQPGDDLVTLAEAEASRLFSAAAGRALRRELERRFCALTANHLCVDFHPEFFQGDLVFALGCAHAVPVFACGGVPCDNAAFPRGMLLAPRARGTTKPFHLPLLSNVGRRALVSAREPYDPIQVQTALAALPRAPLSLPERQAAETIIRRVYLSAPVLGQQSFRDQMSVANALLWKELTAPGFRLPPLLSLDMQRLAAELVISDLARPGTLACDLLLEPELTQAVFHALNGSRACWTLGEDPKSTGAAKGTFLFWAVDEQKRGVRLTLLAEEHALAGTNPAGQPDPAAPRFPLKASALTEALRQGRLLPSVYLSFAALGLARGLVCCGGVFQCAYLPRMAEGTATALRWCGDAGRAARIAVSSPLCTGTLPLRARVSPPHGETADCAAGPVELLVSGGITASTWEELAETSFQEAFFRALAYHYEDLVPPDEREDGWMEALNPGLPPRQALARQEQSCIKRLPPCAWR